MQNLKYNTTNLSTKHEQSHRRREQTWRERMRREGLGVWGQQMQTIIYITGKQQGPKSMGNYIQYPVINRNEKE